MGRLECGLEFPRETLGKLAAAAVEFLEVPVGGLLFMELRPVEGQPRTLAVEGYRRDPRGHPARKQDG